ncbi:Cu(I)-responsive transcriptional regulator [Gilvimarinus xylanilyticus]|uniref:HTH-type transcriptional regulator CueR n=1 Tax=Gilvimarinus xylanilyticus TaxID=2944139 RepID=A0A9X2HWT5_9GAMM|nr:Cu(I)-responsive transcriptional regulator [Gilvimarinus xylanilyticus]MCP8898021.1 Cu(I)-responsive transcriptional regulator [Gilvimarinus xylanilyticus]
MKIGEVARETGLSAKAIRHYEAEGLVSSRRLDNGYRDYTQANVTQLTLIARARKVGFSLDECRELLTLQGDTDRHSSDVKRAVEHKIAQLDEQLDHLHAMRDTLVALASRCRGDEAPECAILQNLSRPQPGMTFTVLEGSHEPIGGKS